MSFHKLISKIGSAILSPGSKKSPYDIWMMRNEPDRSQFKAMGSDSQSWAYRPLVSIVTPVYNPVKYDITRCIQSVIDQVYEKWELCIVDGGSDKSYVKRIIERYAKKDKRIKFVSLSQNKGIAGNSNEALKLATGEYIGFLDHDDMLAPFALYEVVKLLNQSPELDFIYSDEDKIPAKGKNIYLQPGWFREVFLSYNYLCHFAGKRYEPFFKPEWSPDTILSYNYACHFLVVRKRILDEIGGFREGYEGAQDYDLILRVVNKTNNIKRIPKILYHWRATLESTASKTTIKPLASAAGKKAIMEYIKCKGLEAEVLDGPCPTWYRVKYSVSSLQKVNIIIPTRDKVDLLKRCVSSILNKTDYKNYEIMIVDNQSIEKETIAYFNTLNNEKRIRVLQYDKPYNYSAINNYAAKSTDAQFLLFLNNDTEVISSEWLTAMLEFAQREDVGAVGAKLYYQDDTIQHAGVIIGLMGLAAHPYQRLPRSDFGYMGRTNIVQNLSAVTAACMMVRKDVFDEVGGFDEGLEVAFNDVDLCLKIREKGYLIVFTPYAELYHHELASRGRDDTEEKRTRSLQETTTVGNRWKKTVTDGDPYYNPNLSLDKTDFSIKL
ncbi:MAG: hypothetical protein A2132_00290 [Nitrospirae bacterium RBG_16_43_11]|nr:MAG: hypothetical protein A2132_00290 [Nitrospirae bacterium RBG_16_43_11]